MIYDFMFYDKIDTFYSQVAIQDKNPKKPNKTSSQNLNHSFFLFLIATQARNLHIKLYVYNKDSITHCLVPNIPAIQVSKENQSKENNKKQIEQYDERIKSFANSLSATLPISLYFYFVEIKPCLLEQKAEASSIYKALKEYIKMSPISIDKILQNPPIPQSHYYSVLETQQILSNISKDGLGMVFSHSPHYRIPLKNPPKDYFSHIITALKQQQEVPFDTQRGIVLLSLKPNLRTFATIICDIASLRSYFRTNTSHIDTLASFEKPLTYLVPKSVFSKQFCPNALGLVLVGLPYDMPLAILATLLLGEEIDYFCLSSMQDTSKSKMIKVDSSASKTLESKTNPKTFLDILKKPFCFQHSLLQNPKILNIAQNGTRIDIQRLKHTNLSSLIHTRINDKGKTLIIYLSTRHPSAFFLSNPAKQMDKSQKLCFSSLLDIAFESNPRLICEHITRHYPNGKELLLNFAKIAPNEYDAIFSLPNDTTISHNLTDILGIGAFVMGLSPNANTMALLKSAYEFVRDKGPRVDYILVRENGLLKIDYGRIIRSILSFKCAKIENCVLSFGILDSLAEFLATIVRDAKTNLNVTHIMPLGDMLTHSIFLDRFLNYLPKHITLILPQNAKVDYE